MNKEKASIFIAAAIGSFALLISAAGLYRGDEFSDHYLGLFCGITLIGTALIHHLQTKQN